MKIKMCKATLTRDLVFTNFSLENLGHAKLSKCAGLILWKAGYDVWLNNQRGTLFSEDHSNSSISYLDYWDFR
jgi:hypothetical protein